MIDDGINKDHLDFGDRASWGFSAISKDKDSDIQLGGGHGKTWDVKECTEKSKPMFSYQVPMSPALSVGKNMAWPRMSLLFLCKSSPRMAKAPSPLSYPVSNGLRKMPRSTPKSRLSTCHWGFRPLRPAPTLWIKLSRPLQKVDCLLSLPLAIQQGRWMILGNEGRISYLLCLFSDACDVVPAGNPNVYTVAASDKTDTLDPRSCYGKCVAITAPGKLIIECLSVI